MDRAGFRRCLQRVSSGASGRTPCRRLQPTGVGLTRSVLAAEPGQRWRAGGRRWAACFELQLGHAARACPSGEYGVLPAEALARGSLADRGGRRVGCSAACGLSGAREAGGRALSRRRRLVRGVRVARVASSAGEPGGPADGRHGTAVLRARNARPAPFVVCRDDRYRGFELLDHHVRRPPASGSREVGVGGPRARDSSSAPSSSPRSCSRSCGCCSPRFPATSRWSGRTRRSRARIDRAASSLGFAASVCLAILLVARWLKATRSCPPCQRSGRGRSAHAALPGWADPAGGVHRRRSRRISSGRRSWVWCWFRSCFSQVSGERGLRGPRSETCWSIWAR